MSIGTTRLRRNRRCAQVVVAIHRSSDTERRSALPVGAWQQHVVRRPPVDRSNVARPVAAGQGMVPQGRGIFFDPTGTENIDVVAARSVAPGAMFGAESAFVRFPAPDDRRTTCRQPERRPAADTGADPDDSGRAPVDAAAVFLRFPAESSGSNAQIRRPGEVAPRQRFSRHLPACRRFVPAAWPGEDTASVEIAAGGRGQRAWRLARPVASPACRRGSGTRTARSRAAV